MRFLHHFTIYYIYLLHFTTDTLYCETYLFILRTERYNDYVTFIEQQDLLDCRNE